MPRKPRIEYREAVYHVMSRGNRGDAIFLDERDCETFVDTLDEACTKTGWLIVRRVHLFHTEMLERLDGVIGKTGKRGLQGRKNP